MATPEEHARRHISSFLQVARALLKSAQNLCQDFTDRLSGHLACSCTEDSSASSSDIDVLDGAIDLPRLNSSTQRQQPYIAARRIAAAVIQKSVGCIDVAIPAKLREH